MRLRYIKKLKNDSRAVATKQCGALKMMYKFEHVAFGTTYN